MKVPRPFKVYKKRGFSRCMACDKFKNTNMFYADGRTFILCEYDYVDYWENTDELPKDFIDYNFKEWG